MARKVYRQKSLAGEKRGRHEFRGSHPACPQVRLRRILPVQAAEARSGEILTRLSPWPGRVRTTKMRRKMKDWIYVGTALSIRAEKIKSGSGKYYKSITHFLLFHFFSKFSTKKTN